MVDCSGTLARRSGAEGDQTVEGTMKGPGKDALGCQKESGAQKWEAPAQ